MKRTRAFTLIELLVVISVIVLLIGLMVPSLGKSREAARTEICASNVRQIGIALSGYTMSNKNYYPGDHRSWGGGLSWVAWVPRLRPYLGDMSGFYYCPSAPKEYRFQPRFGFPLTPGRDPKLYGYMENEFPMTGVEFFCYGYNGWGVQRFSIPHWGLGGHVAPQEPGAVTAPTDRERYFRENHDYDIKVPFEMYAVADSDANGNWDTWITPQTDAPLCRPGQRHGRRAKTLFCDMGVRFVPYDDFLSARPELRRRWNNDNIAH
jgi:prepilin-type N-terminal cleavage/methylation domain-containing protein